MSKLVHVLVVLIIVLAGFGSAVLHLWNWLMPDLFGLKTIGYGQALGLMGLSWLLFGGLRGFGMHSPSRRLRADERARLRDFVERCGAPDA